MITSDGVDEMWKQLFVSGIFMAFMLGVGYYLGYTDGQFRERKKAKKSKRM